MSSVFGGLTNAVSSLFANPLIDKATSDDETPTPGYVYSDIARQSYEGGTSNERLCEALLARLDDKSPAVKIKTLLVMKYLLEKGHPAYQRLMQAQSERIRPQLHFRAPPDPLRGDTPSRLVREKAQVVLNLIYQHREQAEPHMESQSSMPSMSTGRMTGFGSDTMRTHHASNSGGGSGAPTSWNVRGPTAIESTYNPNANKTPTLLDKARDAMASLQERISGPAATKAHVEPSSQYRPANIAPGANQSAATQHTTVSPEVAFTQSETKLGGWDDGDSGADSTAEARALATLTHGRALLPSRSELASYRQLVQRQSAVKVSAALDFVLRRAPWRERLRALCGLEELLRSPPIETVLEHFSSDGYVAVLELSKAVQSSVRDVASRVLKLLPEPDHVEEEAPSSLFSNLSISDSSGQLDGRSDAYEEPSGLFAGLTASHDSAASDTTTPSLLDSLESSSASASVQVSHSSQPSLLLDLGGGETRSAVPQVHDAVPVQTVQEPHPLDSVLAAFTTPQPTPYASSYATPPQAYAYPQYTPPVAHTDDFAKAAATPAEEGGFSFIGGQQSDPFDILNAKRR